LAARDKLPARAADNHSKGEQTMNDEVLKTLEKTNEEICAIGEELGKIYKRLEAALGTVKMCERFNTAPDFDDSHRTMNTRICVYTDALDNLNLAIEKVNRQGF